MRSMWKVMVGVVAVLFVAVCLVGCGSGQQKKAQELSAKIAAITQKMEAEIQANPAQAAEIQTKYNKELEPLQKEAAALAVGK
jgi:cytochrome oxidase assembly protein ShyY1